MATCPEFFRVVWSHLSHVLIMLSTVSFDVNENNIIQRSQHEGPGAPGGDVTSTLISPVFCPLPRQGVTWDCFGFFPPSFPTSPLPPMSQ